MTDRMTTVADIASWRMCIGCGACVFACPNRAVTLIDMIDDGIRPQVDSQKCECCGKCVKICPGYTTDHQRETWPKGYRRDLAAGWGPILEIWEGYAADTEIRFAGSSGGAATMLALYCLEKRGMKAVLHTGADPLRPWKNLTVKSSGRKDLLERTGSRYAPASPAESFETIMKSGGQWVFIGKPCDLVALSRAQRLFPGLSRHIGAAVSIFCAGTPSTRGTRDLLKTLEITEDDLLHFRFRGRGWPGFVAAKERGKEGWRELVSYADSWSFLQKYRPYRCYLCPDGTGEFADIACGDPWYRDVDPDEAGQSLLLARTGRGQEIVRGAMREGYLSLRSGTAVMLTASQGNLLRKRGAVWGRRLALWLCGIPAPRLAGFSLLKNWLTLPLREKGRSLTGTIRRIFMRKYRRSTPYLAGEREPHHVPDTG